MKYCTHCGAELLDEAVICPKCGCWVNSASKPSGQSKAKTNACAIVGFILSMVSILFVTSFWNLMALAGLIVSGVGLRQLVKNDEQKGKGFAISGVVVGAFLLLLTLFIWFSMMAA